MLLKPDPPLISRLLRDETDERYRYLIRHGVLHFVEAETLTLYVELAQIPNIIVVYRRPSERITNADKLSLEQRGLKHVPLLEGEEKLKQLTLSYNEITRIENIVSLPNLTYLDLASNKLSEVNKLPALQHLRILNLSKNQLTKIENLEGLPNLDVLDLNENQIAKIENLAKLPNLRILNLSNNLITVLEMPEAMMNLQELNLRKNLIGEVGQLGKMNSLLRLYLSNNKLASVEGVRSLPALSEITLENNPLEQSEGLLRNLRTQFPSLQYFNLQKVTLLISNLSHQQHSLAEKISQHQAQSSLHKSLQAGSSKREPIGSMPNSVATKRTLTVAQGYREECLGQNRSTSGHVPMQVF